MNGEDIGKHRSRAEFRSRGREQQRYYHPTRKKGQWCLNLEAGP